MRMKQTVLLAVGMGLALAACKSGPTGRIKASDEGDLTGDTAAGAGVYNQQVPDAVGKLLALHRSTNTRVKSTMCVLGIDNQSAENLGDWEEQLYDLITNSINQSGDYITVSRRVVDRALQEGGMRQDDLLLPRYRRQFIEILETAGNPVEILLFPKLSSGTTTSGNTKQRDYLMTLEMIDVETGWQQNPSTKIRKEYTR